MESKSIGKDSMLGFYMMPPTIDENFDQVAYQEHIKNLDKLIDAQKLEVENFSPDDFKNHQLPLARIKKIMKSDEDVRMISAETPALFGKACELFIIELTHRAWIHTEEGKRRILQKNHITACIDKTDIFDFLQDLVHTRNS
ncbi:unnamed protein product [Blepharisma stoltei]|uniref:Transcription factor CBF/NF-Y/archaeal histone domain-containing protein n=1 Tax=Blepharisma stoltei TaxID=1481888 RepID=A0AAU9K4D3_9CILI|nr:unnamed protein product [Blepharisma stoltei]